MSLSSDHSPINFRAHTSQSLGWPPHPVNMMIKNAFYYLQEYHPVPRPQNSARGHPRQFQRFQPTVDAFKYAFLPQTIPAWNALPQAVAEADSFDTFTDI